MEQTYWLLAVDDEPDILRTNRKYLEARGYKVDTVMASVLALSNIQTAPVFAAVEEERTIIRFEELPEKYAVQELELGAAEEDIRFQGSLWTDMVIVKQKNEELMSMSRSYRPGMRWTWKWSCRRFS